MTFEFELVVNSTYCTCVNKPEYEQDQNMTKLMHLCCHPCITIQKLQHLYNSGEHINMTSFKNRTALSYLCDNIKVTTELLKYMIEAGANINISMDDNWSPLMCLCNNTSVTKELLEYFIEIGNANVNVKSMFGSSIIHIISSNRFASLECLQYLLFKMNPDEHLLHLVDDENETPLFCACYAGKLDYIKYFLETLDYDPNHIDVDSWTPLMHHCNENVNIDCIKCLVENGAIINKSGYRGNAPLISICMNGHNLECIKYLIENNADIEVVSHDDNNTPLLILCERGTSECIKYLIQCGANVNHKNKNNQTALEILYKKNSNHECIIDLVKTGANIYDLPQNIMENVKIFSEQNSDIIYL